MIGATRQLIARYAHINWALADQSMVSGANFVTGILLARYLGLEEFGYFTLVWMAILFVNSIQHAAINAPMMSIGPKQSQAETPAYYGAVVMQQIAFSCVAFFLLFAGVKLTAIAFPEWNVKDLALPFAVTASVCQFQAFFRRYFFTRGRAAAAFSIDTARYLGQIAILAWLFLSDPELMDTNRTLWVFSLTAAVATVYGAFRFDPFKINAVTVRTVASNHWRFAKWLIASVVMRWSPGNLFFVAAGALLGASAVGALKAAQNLIAITHILIQGLENVVPARAAWHLKHGGGKAMSHYLRRVAKFGGLAMLAVAGIAAAAPELWLDLVFGQEYQGYGYLVRGWAVVYVLMFLSLPLRSGLRALEITRPIFWSTACAALFSLLAAFPLTQHLGLTGAVIGAATVNVILVTILWYSLRKGLG